MKMKLWNLESGTTCFDNHICIILCYFVWTLLYLHCVYLLTFILCVLHCACGGGGGNMMQCANIL